MGMPQPIHRMSAEEFAAWELDQPVRYEFFRGEVFQVFAMGGARRVHVAVTGNCHAALKRHLRGTPCQAFMNDMKVHVLETGDQFYPDVVVTCDKRDLTADLEMHYPKLLIEVLSPSTATFDRGDKFLIYRTLPSLLEYVLIDPDTKTTEVYRRQPNGRDWLLSTGDAAQGLFLASVDLLIPGAELFENV